MKNYTIYVNLGIIRVNRKIQWIEKFGGFENSMSWKIRKVEKFDEKKNLVISFSSVFLLKYIL